VAVAGCHVARALAPADLRAALDAERESVGGTGFAPGRTDAHDHGADPSPVDAVGRPGVPGSATPGQGARNR
jgi:hypothetical protein